MTKAKADDAQIDDAPAPLMLGEDYQALSTALSRIERAVNRTHGERPTALGLVDRANDIADRLLVE